MRGFTILGVCVIFTIGYALVFQIIVYPALVSNSSLQESFIYNSSLLNVISGILQIPIFIAAGIVGSVLYDVLQHGREIL